ncbi:fatty acid desaturase [Psychromarinibacter sp. C21-152]|uniref:Fatty acid desaturase n=1 Tax=Psychromarinibacter sediminicola TaxID=3033385 RepID=A0AAE3NYR7_9RHOB|nr:fatty acid desaturase [Psychromarinibacter sediminicola]MDF0603167.1 fatty acid desaturase [Psychromarinibacter sediminicola]
MDDPRASTGDPVDARQWSRILVRYRTPRAARSVRELIVTLAPFFAIWAVAWWSLSYSTALAMLLALCNAAFLLRLFMIQHDCGHGSFFRSKRLCNWIGRAIGVITLTPYDVWRETHAIHHASTGNLDRRGIGDLPTMTVAEYRAMGRLKRGLYRLVRHPLFLFGVVPFYSFFLQNRLPVGLMRSGWKYWLSAMATNAGIAAILTALLWFGGWKLVVFVFLPTMLLAAMIGMWFFYVQHQFEHTSWSRDADWDIQTAALEGSSYYDLPPILQWITGNIGVHHVHHLASRIPFYRLPEVLRDHEALANSNRVTLRESFGCARLALWDQSEHRLVTFAEARRVPA